MGLERTIRRFRRTAVRWMWAVIHFVPRTVSSFLSATGHAIKRWWENRYFRYLVRGLPTLIVAGLCAFLAIGAVLEPPEVLAETYKQAAKSALASGNFEAAKLYYRRVVELDAADSDALFELARAAQETEDYPRLAALMEQLAPENFNDPDYQPGHFQAHRAQGEAHFHAAASSTQHFDLSLQHFRAALQLRPDDAIVHARLGEVYFRMGLYEPSMEHLGRIALEEPTARLVLAKAHALHAIALESQGDAVGSQKNEERAKYWGDKAQEHYRRLLAQDPHDVNARVSLADTTMFLEEYQQAAQILQQGSKLSDDPRLRVGLARVYAAWAESMDEAQKDRRYQLLSTALLLSPNDQVLYGLMINLLQGESAKDARDFLLDNIAQGRAVAVSHLLLGTVDLERNSPEQAGYHLERAFEESPQTPTIINNLAWYLALSSEDKSQADRALALINPLVERFPQELRFLDTRGHVLLKLGRYREAVRDLERALATHASQAATHEALAKAYRQLGQTELADRHARKAESIRESQVETR